MTARWLAAVGLAVVLSVAGNAIGLPSPALFGGLAAGLLVSLVARWELEPPKAGVRAAQGTLGVAIGALVQSETLREVGSNAVPILAVSVATLGLSIASGLLLARFTDIDRPTAAFGMIAGGASGVVAIADDLGADNRLVAVMQYLRVLVVVVLIPPLAEGVFPAGDGGGTSHLADPSDPERLVYLGACIAIGVPLARAVRLPAGTLLGPMICAAAFALAGGDWAAPPPSVLQDVAFIAIGGQVGLRFTPESLRLARRIVLPVLGLVAAVMVLCAGLGVLLSSLADVSEVDGYLATTPGGIYAVLAAGVSTGADTTFVLAVQVVRVFVMLLAAPLIARRLQDSAARSPTQPSAR